MKKSKRKMKIKKTTIISRLLFSVYLIMTIIVLGILLSMNVIPSKYMMPVLVTYLIITSISGLFAWQNSFKNWVKNIGNTIFIIGIIVSSIGLYYLNSTLNLFSRIQSKDYQVENYYVVVLKDSKYNLISDIKDKILGTYANNQKNYTFSLDEVTKKVSVDIDEYESFYDSASALEKKEVDAILISSVNRDMVHEEIKEFDKNTRIIHTVSVKIKNETVVKEANVTNEPFNIYISGIDIYGDITSVSRSDVNIIATVNPVTHKVLLTTIPRDYYVQLHDTEGSYKDKLTHAGIYGVDMSVKTIEDLLNIDINNYVRVNFTTLIDLVDALGGIDINSEYEFRAVSGEYFNQGVNHVNGQEALAFSRERKAFSDGDRQRGKNQQQVITAILNKMLSSKTLITKYTSILNSLGGSFETNLDTNKIYKLVNMQLDKMPSWSIESISLNGFDSRGYTYSISYQELYVMEPDMDTVNAAIAKIDSIEKGE